MTAPAALTERSAFAYIARSLVRTRSAHILVSTRRLNTMSRRCELTGVGPMVGHNVSHSNIKTKRRFLPALSPATLQSDALGQSFRLRISNAALRTLDFRGGLDTFLVKARDEQLSPRALKIKRQLKAKLAEAKAAA
jgi:large subunit ribosomal protein L28